MGKAKIDKDMQETVHQEQLCSEKCEVAAEMENQLQARLRVGRENHSLQQRQREGRPRMESTN